MVNLREMVDLAWMRYAETSTAHLLRWGLGASLIVLAIGIIGPDLQAQVPVPLPPPGSAVVQGTTEADIEWILLNEEQQAVFEAGDYERAERVGGLALRHAEGRGRQADVATTLNNLGAVYFAQGRHDDAEGHFARALAIHESLLGPEHPEVAKNLNNLGQVFLVLRRFDDAEPLLLRAIAINESALGPVDETATSLHNLATLYVASGRYREAEALLRQVVVIREEVLGPEHPQAVVARESLAGVGRALRAKGTRQGERF
jgi:tetratricopeptide (TPR) repeat protein